MVKVNRMMHKLCGKPFYEIEDEEIAKCPHCKKKLETDDCEETTSKRIVVDPVSGDPSYKAIKK